MLTKEQLAERVNYIGASEAAAVLGLSRYKTALEVWAEKTKRIEPEDISMRWPVRFGNRLEDVVADFFTEETGKKVQRVTETIFHPKYKFLGANLDRRVVGEKAVLECKTTAAWKAEEWADDQFPAEYVIQVMHQLAVTGLSKGYLAVAIGNNDFKIKEIDRDEKVLADLVARLADFWERFVVPNVMPAVTGQDKDALDKLFPKAEETKEIELGDDADAIAEIYEALQQDAKALDSQIEKQKNQLKALLGDASRGKTLHRRIYWSNVGPIARLDVDALKDKLPKVFKRFAKMTTQRRFLVRPTKEASNA